jgi:biofilm PGA synthesis lipoprotein PgaB
MPQEMVKHPLLAAPQTGDRYPRILGAQVTLFESRNDEAFGRSLDQMRNAGVNTLIFRVFQNPGDRKHGFIQGTARMGVYFETDQAPVVEDVLGRVCFMAHQRGMKVFAWMTTRQSAWVLQKRLDLSGWMYDPEKRNLIRTAGLDLFHPEVVVYLQELYNDLAQYPIDGILFQDDLVLRHTEGFGPEAERLYLDSFGKVLQPAHLFVTDHGRVKYKPEFWTWADWKNKRILEVIDAIVEVVSMERPDILWALNGYYESVTDPGNGLAWYSQNLARALAHRIDYLSIMAYHRQIMEELQISYHEALKLLTAMSQDAVFIAKNPDRVLMKIQAMDWKTEQPLPGNEIRQVLDAVLTGGRTGLIYVRGQHPPPLTPVREAFSK